MTSSKWSTSSTITPPAPAPTIGSAPVRRGRARRRGQSRSGGGSRRRRTACPGAIVAIRAPTGTVDPSAPASLNSGPGHPAVAVERRGESTAGDGRDELCDAAEEALGVAVAQILRGIPISVAAAGLAKAIRAPRRAPASGRTRRPRRSRRSREGSALYKYAALASMPTRGRIVELYAVACRVACAWDTRCGRRYAGGRAPVAQLDRAVGLLIRMVAGSSPAGGIGAPGAGARPRSPEGRHARFLSLAVGVAQLVELLVVVQAVAGSSPVAHPSTAARQGVADRVP